MNRKYLKAAIPALLIATGVSMLACSKEKSDTYGATNTNSITELITAHAWRIKDIKVVNPYTSRDSSVIKACHTTGARIGFGITGGYYTYAFIDSSAGGCDSTIFPYDTGLWGLNSAGDSVLLRGTRASYAMKLQYAGTDSLMLTYNDSISQIPFKKTITFIK